MPVVRAAGDGREVALLRWGLVPVWARDATAAARAINARAETVAEKPTFRGPLRRRRCVVPASGFYEWRRAGGRKEPWFFCLRRRRGAARPGGAVGPLDRPGDGGGAGDLRDRHHDRERAGGPGPRPDAGDPAAGDEDAWLDPDLDEPEALFSLLGPYPAEAMAGHPVSATVNRAGTEGEDLMAPLNSA